MYEFVETFDKESQEIMTCGFLEKKKKKNLWRVQKEMALFKNTHFKVINILTGRTELL